MLQVDHFQTGMGPNNAIYYRRTVMKFIIASLLTCMLTLTVWAAGTVNINSASAEEIAESMNGVGLAKAQEIVRYRETNGNFAHIDELINVKGVGIRTVDKNRDIIFVEEVAVETKE
jgi:competence protein ComEA